MDLGVESFGDGVGDGMDEVGEQVDEVPFNLVGFNSPKLASAWMEGRVGGWRVDTSTRSPTFEC